MVRSLTPYRWAISRFFTSFCEFDSAFCTSRDLVLRIPARIVTLWGKLKSLFQPIGDFSSRDARISNALAAANQWYSTFRRINCPESLVEIRVTTVTGALAKAATRS